MESKLEVLNNKIEVYQPVVFKKGIKFVGHIPRVKKMTIADCRIGVPVLTFAGSLFKVEQILQNKKRPEDLTIAVGDGVNGAMYGSYKGVFSSIFINKDK